jgi:molecular chaperone DnaJ
MADQDLYAELGLSKSASEDDIKSAYRKLARKHHPDVNPGKPEAEEKFKKLSAAYDVLSNREKRALYDEFGMEGVKSGFDPEKARAYRQWSEARHASGGDGGGMPFDFDLSDLMGGRRVRRGSHAMAGQDLVTAVELDLKTALAGVEVELHVPAAEPCEVCAGSGEKPGSEARTCADCGGAGRTQVVRGPMRLMSVCATCGGDGKIHDACERCEGAGRVELVRELRVRIPKGADDGDELRVRGKGGPGLYGGPPGDLIVRVRLKPHEHFRREGLDLSLKLPVTLAEAFGGGSIAVPTPHGTVQMKVPPRSQQGTRLRLKGKGVARGEQHGDLYVELDVRLPDRDDEALLAALRAAEASYARPPREGVEL